MSTNQIKTLRVELERAEVSLKDFYAKAYLAAMNQARTIFHVSATKVTSAMLEQLANNDDDVKKARQSICDIKQKIVDAESRAELDENKKPISIVQDQLERVRIDEVNLPEEFSGEAQPSSKRLNAKQLYGFIRQQVETIADNMRELTRLVEDRPETWNRDFWESDVLENATIYRCHLTDYIELARLITRSSSSKAVHSEMRGFSAYVRSLRDDCKSLAELAKIQARGF